MDNGEHYLSQDFFSRKKIFFLQPHINCSAKKKYFSSKEKILVPRKTIFPPRQKFLCQEKIFLSQD